MLHARPQSRRGRRGAAVAALLLFLALLAAGLELGPLRPAPVAALQAQTLRRMTDRAVDRHVPAAAGDRRGTIPTTHTDRLWTYTPRTITYGGQRRSYLIVSPRGQVTGLLPVLVELQGCCGVVTSEAHRSAFQVVAQPPAILVYPQASGPPHHQHWNAGTCCGPAAAEHVDDVGFVAAVIAEVQRSVPHAAPGKVYLAGFSNGARLAFRVACERPDLLAAVAVYAGVEASACDGKRPPPMTLLDSVGSRDGEVRLRPTQKPLRHGSFTDPSVAQQVGYYLIADHCSTDTTVAVAGTLTETVWACPDGRRVGIAVFAGLDHRWPQTHGRTPSAQQMLWDFLFGVGR